MVIPKDLEQFNLVTPPAPDELNYFAHATALVYGRTNYALETSEYMPFNHSVGPSLMAAPVIFIFSLVDRWNHDAVTERRTREALYHSWTGLAFPVATQIYAVLGAFLLFLILDDSVGCRYPAVTTGISIVASGVLYFAYRRSISSHIYEFMIISLALFLVWRPPRGHWGDGWRKWGLTGLVAAFIFLVRYNDLPIAIAFIWATLAAHFAPGTVTGWTRLSPARRVALAQFLTLAAVVSVMASVSTRAHVNGGELWNAGVVHQKLFGRSAVFFYERFVHVLFGRDWSLFITAPLVLLGLGSCGVLGPKRYLAIPFLIALLGNFVLTLSWGTQGSCFGYRYFVPAATPLATIGLSRWIERGAHPGGRLALAATMAVIPALLLLIFGSSWPLIVTEGSTKWGTGWVNNDYLTNSFRALFLQTRETFNSIVPLSGIGVVGRWLGVKDGVADPISPLTTARLVAIWLLPLALGGTLARFFGRKAHE